MTSPLAIAQALIRCPSVTPEDGGALDYLAGLLRSAGFMVERQRFSEPGFPDIDNLYARFGVEAPVLLFAGHTDVVPPGEASAWRFDPFSAQLAEGALWGRGAVDMKGGLAACIGAALAFVRQGGFRGSVAFLVTGDEEGPAVNGTTKLLDWARARGERFDHCLLAEPTCARVFGDSIKVGRRGSLSGRLSVAGRQGHVAYPHLADNPIPALARIVQRLTAEPLDSGTEHFAPSHLEFVSIDGGTGAFNVIPGEARAMFNVRFNDLWTAESLAQELRGRVERAAEGATASLRFEPSNAPAFLTRPDAFVDQLARAIEQETGVRPKLSTAGGTSDARFIRSACPVLEFGLMGATMHAVDERVSVAELEALERIVGRVLRGYFDGAV
jgi:succinyl-diaminopimelate desuccinylase